MAEEAPTFSSEYAAQLSFGNLCKLTLKVRNDHYTLNGEELQKAASESADFRTKDNSFRVRVTFLRTPMTPSDRSSR